VDQGSSFALWLTDGKSGALHRFAGFKEGDGDKLGAALSSRFGLPPLTPGRVSAAGGNFAGLRFRGGALELVAADGSVVVPLPLAAVGGVTAPGKGEVELACVDADTTEKDDEVLLEMRLVVPDALAIDGVTRAGGGGGGGASGGGGGGGGEDDEGGGGGGEESMASALHRALAARTAVSGGAGAPPLAVIPDELGHFLVPRGRFAVELFPAHLRLVSPSADFKVRYASITRMTLLPLPTPTGSHVDATRYVIVISLDDPLRQGASRHAHLVLQVDRGPASLDLAVPAADVAAGRYEGLGAAGPVVAGDAPKTLASLLKKVSGKPVYKPESFLSKKEQRGVRCTHKASAGLLFPLDKSIMFVHKPTVWLRNADVEKVTLHRGGAGARTFDLTLRVRAGAGEGAKDYLFQALDREEAKGMHDFFKDKGLSVLDEGGGADEGGAGDGKRKKLLAAGAYDVDGSDGDGDEDEDEEDDDFDEKDADKEEADAEAEDDDDESEAGDDDDDSEGAGKKGKGKKRPAPKASKKAKPPAKKRKGHEDDSDDDDE